MNYKKLLLIAALTLVGVMARADILTLDDCRALALNHNKELLKYDMQRRAAHLDNKAAYTNFLPKVSATGVYMHTGKELSLLSDDQKNTLSNIGTALSMPELNVVGAGLVDALHTDTRDIAGVAVMLTQPLYMGGKIRAYYNITKYAEQLSGFQYDTQKQDLLVRVEETYWNIVALMSKKRLAESYLNLVETLDNDISCMVNEGFATKADALSVKVKVNEAKMTIVTIDNGIEILKMLMCQLCGLEITSEITLADESIEMPTFADTPIDEQDVNLYNSRPELRSLLTAVNIYDEKVKVERAAFLPSVALTAGYFANYPSVFNSFEEKFKGTWFVGAVVSVPILTWGERSYKVSAARARAQCARYDYDDACENVSLQVSQCRQRYVEAQEQVAVSLSSQSEAEENLKYATVGLREGVIPVINVIEAQTAWLSARSSLINATIDLHVANIYYRKALGLIK